jgi:hypothetical protein
MTVYTVALGYAQSGAFSQLESTTAGEAHDRDENLKKLPTHQRRSIIKGKSNLTCWCVPVVAPNPALSWGP